MEDYLQYMRTLRSQMNDAEDEAAKSSVEEQMLLTTIETNDSDLLSAKSNLAKLKGKADEMVKAKGDICSQILDRQRKIASLESDSVTLIQALDLIQQERATLSSKLLEKSAYYSKVAEHMNAKLREQQDWFSSRKLPRDAGEDGKNTYDQQVSETEGNTSIESHLTADNLSDEANNSISSISELESAKAMLYHIRQMKLELVMENTRMKESAEQVARHMNNFKPELWAMDIDTLGEEYRALLSDKAGETNFLSSLQQQMDKIKGISHMVTCACGVEYQVEAGLHI